MASISHYQSVSMSMRYITTFSAAVIAEVAAQVVHGRQYMSAQFFSLSISAARTGRVGSAAPAACCGWSHLQHGLLVNLVHRLQQRRRLHDEYIVQRTQQRRQDVDVAHSTGRCCARSRASPGSSVRAACRRRAERSAMRGWAPYRSRSPPRQRQLQQRQ